MNCVKIFFIYQSSWYIVPSEYNWILKLPFQVWKNFKDVFLGPFPMKKLNKLEMSGEFGLQLHCNQRTWFESPRLPTILCPNANFTFPFPKKLYHPGALCHRLYISGLIDPTSSSSYCLSFLLFKVTVFTLSYFSLFVLKFHFNESFTKNTPSKISLKHWWFLH